MVTHFDRFILPSIAQVEYRIGDENHLLVDSAMTPVERLRDAHLRGGELPAAGPGALVKRALTPLAMRIFAQDATILRAQTETVRRFGGEQFISTEIDVIGKHIAALLKAAELGEPATEAAHEVDLIV
jgi:hypothetical protein